MAQSNSLDSSYITHLDGLRGIALLGVLFFHFDVKYFDGGFVGVDIFLTLSGFLITRHIIVEDQKPTRFSLRKFFIRRFFRLYPSSAVTTLLTVLCSGAVFPGRHHKTVSLSGLSSLLFSSNVFFHSQSGYFGGTSHMKPLLHTWSLSLEEQFYIIWSPVIALLLSKSASRTTIFVMLSILTIFSVAFGVVFMPDKSSLVFFELPARAHQFAIGAATAVVHYYDKNERATFKLLEKIQIGNRLHGCIFPGLIAELLFLSSLSYMLIAFIFTPQPPGPVQMVQLSFATVVFIQTGDSVSSKLFLSNHLITFLGRLSYSAYLVHWPLFVFTRYVQSGFLLSPPSPILMIFLTILLASMMKTFVEDKFRKYGWRTSKALAVIIASTVLLCVQGAMSKDFSFQLSGGGEGVEKQKSLQHLHDNALPSSLYDKRICSAFSSKGALNSPPQGGLCGIGPQGRNISMYLYGNSFLQHLYPALFVLARRKKIVFRGFLTVECRSVIPILSGCPPGESPHCCKLHVVLWDDIRSLRKGSIVVFSNLWFWKSLKDMQSSLYGIHKELSALGVKMIVITEPPGMDIQYQSYSSCVELKRKFLISWLEKTVGIINLGNCGVDFEYGLKPLSSLKKILPKLKRTYVHRRLLESQWYDKVATGHPGIRIINLFNKLCRNKYTKSHIESVCTLPLGKGP